jgi:hypothetical protein
MGDVDSDAVTTELEPSRISDVEQQNTASERAYLSALVPGLGQLLQGRVLAAGLHFGTVCAYMAGALSLGGRRALVIALLWNVWSVIDAYRHERD